jgi:hypothetical protein
MLYPLWLFLGYMSNHSSQIQQSWHIRPQPFCRHFQPGLFGFYIVFWNSPRMEETDSGAICLFDDPLSFGESGMSGQTYDSDNLTYQGVIGVNHANISRSFTIFRGIVLRTFLYRARKTRSPCRGSPSGGGSL